MARLFWLGVGVWLATLSPALAQEPVAVVAGQSGTVVARDKTGLRTLHLGAPLWEGDVLITNAESRVRVEFEGDARLTLGPDSEAGIASFMPSSGNGGDIVIDMALGIVRALLGGPDPGGFEVRSRAAVAAARSTEFIVEATPETSAVFVAEGMVEVTATATGGLLTVEEGEGVDLPVDGPPGAIKNWGQARIDDVMERTSVAFGR